MAKDYFGNEVRLGDFIAYGSGQGHQKAGFRIGVVIDTEKPTVIPFIKVYYYYDKTGYHKTETPIWKPMRTFGFMKVKQGDFAIIDPDKVSRDLLKVVKEELDKRIK